VVNKEEVTDKGSVWKALLWMFGIPFLILGTSLGYYASHGDEGAGFVAQGGYVTAFVGILLCSIAFI
jgi:hypothetical protein